MQTLDKVRLDQQMWTAWWALPSERQADILRRLQALAAQPVEEWPEAEVRPLAEKGLYLLHADDELRVIFRRSENGEITVLDLVLQETIDRYFSRKS